MAIIPKNTLYGYVKTFWKPLVQQIKDWMDSYWHKEEMIPVSKIEGLTALLNSIPTQNSLNSLLAGVGPITITLSANGNFTIPAGKTLDLIRVESALQQLLAVSDVDTGDDLLGAIEVSAGVVRAVGCSISADLAARQIFISNVTSPVTLKFYIR